MSDTPRTEAALLTWAHFTDEGYGEAPYVDADFARELERELNAAIVLAERLGEGLSHDAPEHQAALLEAFHEWQYNRAQRLHC